MAKIRVYIKDIVSNLYGFGLANSIHFSMMDEEGKETEFNHGYGILFPQGCIRADNTIEPRGAANPRIFTVDEKFYIMCDYVDEQGDNRAAGQVYVWITYDFISFKEVGLQAEAGFESATEEIEINDILVPNIKDRWLRVGAKVAELEYPYPLIKGFADPVFFKWEGSWYFLSTNDLNGNVGIYLRKADSIRELFEEQAQVSVILDYSVENHFIQTFWAPEWHIIGGVPYILFAVGAEQWAPQSHMMKYKGNGSIMDPASWELPVRVKQKDGHYLSEDGITLDMTYLKDGSSSYVVWSERYNIGTSLDSGSMLYIATIDENNPTVLTSEKVLLSRPLYGWENVDGTINNEGPYALLQNGKIYLSYSGGNACGHTYAVGCLVAKSGTDLLNISSWDKYPTPLLSAYSIQGIDGPGHNSFFVDDEGNTMIAYHGQLDMRSSAIHKVQFAKDGFPVFDMSK